MAVIALIEPSEAVLQKALYNSNIGGSLNKRASFSVPPGTHWVVVGCVLADVTEPEDVPTLISGISSLADVTSINGDQVWGQIPASVAAEDHEVVLHVSSRMSMAIGDGDSFNQRIDAHEVIKPPVGKKWCIFVLRVPNAMDAARIAALENAIEGVTGITMAEHLIDGTVSDRASSNAALTIQCHMRIDPVGE